MDDDENIEEEQLQKDILQINEVLGSDEDDGEDSDFDLEVDELLIADDTFSKHKSNVSEEQLAGGQSHAPLLPQEAISVDHAADYGGDREEASIQRLLEINQASQRKLQQLLVRVCQEIIRNEEEQANVSSNSSDHDHYTKANITVRALFRNYMEDGLNKPPPDNEETRHRKECNLPNPFELPRRMWSSQNMKTLEEAVRTDGMKKKVQPLLNRREVLEAKTERLSLVSDLEKVYKEIDDIGLQLRRMHDVPTSELLGDRFRKVDWDFIANVDMEECRSAEECQLYWQNQLHPSIHHGDWSVEEREALLALAAENEHRDWSKIAQDLGTNRTALQCLSMFQQLDPTFINPNFTPEEDELLSELSERFQVGTKVIPFQKVAYFMDGKTQSHVLYRWIKRIDPSVKSGRWSAEEDKKLKKLMERGRNWSRIADELPGRTQFQIRHRWEGSLNPNIKHGSWDIPETIAFLEKTQELGVGRWAKIAKALETPEAKVRTSYMLLHRFKHVVRAYAKWKGQTGPEDPGTEGQREKAYTINDEALYDGSLLPDMIAFQRDKQSSKKTVKSVTLPKPGVKRKRKRGHDWWSAYKDVRDIDDCPEQTKQPAVTARQKAIARMREPAAEEVWEQTHGTASGTGARKPEQIGLKSRAPSAKRAKPGAARDTGNQPTTSRVGNSVKGPMSNAESEVAGVGPFDARADLGGESSDEEAVLQPSFGRGLAGWLQKMRESDAQREAAIQERARRLERKREARAAAGRAPLEEPPVSPFSVPNSVHRLNVQRRAGRKSLTEVDAALLQAVHPSWIHHQRKTSRQTKHSIKALERTRQEKLKRQDLTMVFQLLIKLFDIDVNYTSRLAKQSIAKKRCLNEEPPVDSNGKQAPTDGQQTLNSGKQTSTHGKQTPTSGQQTLNSGKQTPTHGKQAPNDGQQTLNSGKQTPTHGEHTPTNGQQTLNSGKQTPTYGEHTPTSGQQTLNSGKQTPTRGKQTPTSGRLAPTDGQQTLNSGKQTPTYGEYTPTSGQQTLNSGKQTPTRGKQTPTSGRLAPTGGQQAATSDQLASTSCQQTLNSGKQTPTRGKQTPTSGQLAPTRGRLAPTGGQQAATSGQLAPTCGQQAPTSGRQTLTSGWQAPTSGQLAATSGQLAPTSGRHTPNSGRHVPTTGRKTPTTGRKTPTTGWKTPTTGQKTPTSGWQTSTIGRQTPTSGRRAPTTGRKTPTSGRQTSTIVQQTPTSGQLARDSGFLLQGMPNVPLGVNTAPQGMAGVLQALASAIQVKTSAPQGTMSVPQTSVLQGMSSVQHGMTSLPQMMNPVPQRLTSIPQGMTSLPQMMNPVPQGMTSLPQVSTPSPHVVAPVPQGVTCPLQGVTIASQQGTSGPGMNHPHGVINSFPGATSKSQGINTSTHAFAHSSQVFAFGPQAVSAASKGLGSLLAPKAGTMTPQAGTIASQAGTIASQAGTMTPKAGTTCIASQAETIASQAGTIASPAGTMTPQAGTIASQAGTIASQAGTIASQAGTMTPQAGTMTPQAGTITPQAGTMTPQAGTIASQAGTVTRQGRTIASQAGTIIPQAGTIAPQAGTIASQAGTITPQAGTNSSQAVTIAPPAGHTAPQAGTVIPQAGTIAPQAETIISKAGTVIPQAGIITPQAGTINPQAGTVNPQAGAVIPQTGTTTPQTGAVNPEARNITPQAGTVIPQAGTITPQGRTITPQAGTVIPLALTIAPPAGTVIPQALTIAPPAGAVIPQASTIAPPAGHNVPQAGSSVSHLATSSQPIGLQLAIQGISTAPTCPQLVLQRNNQGQFVLTNSAQSGLVPGGHRQTGGVGPLCAEQSHMSLMSTVPTTNGASSNVTNSHALMSFYILPQLPGSQNQSRFPLVQQPDQPPGGGPSSQGHLHPSPKPIVGSGLTKGPLGALEASKQADAAVASASPSQSSTAVGNDCRKQLKVRLQTGSGVPLTLEQYKSLRDRNSGSSSDLYIQVYPLPKGTTSQADRPSQASPRKRSRGPKRLKKITRRPHSADIPPLPANVMTIQALTTLLQDRPRLESRAESYTLGYKRRLETTHRQKEAGRWSCFAGYLESRNAREEGRGESESAGKAESCLVGSDTDQSGRSLSAPRSPQGLGSSSTDEDPLASIRGSDLFQVLQRRFLSLFIWPGLLSSTRIKGSVLQIGATSYYTEDQKKVKEEADSSQVS